MLKAKTTRLAGNFPQAFLISDNCHLLKTSKIIFLTRIRLINNFFRSQFASFNNGYIFVAENNTECHDCLSWVNDQTGHEIPLLLFDEKPYKRIICQKIVHEVCLFHGNGRKKSLQSSKGDKTMATQMTFDNLAQSILAVHHSAGNYAKNAVNQALTIRNWLIGFYIVEYEQKKSDRAQYGTQLLKNLESKLNTKGLNNTLLKNSRKFYLLYPEVKTIIQNDQSKLIDKLLPKSPTPSDFLTVSQKSST